MGLQTLEIFYSHSAEIEAEEESLFNRKYMVWETSIKTTYGRWHEATHLTVQLLCKSGIQYVFEMIKYIQSETRKLCSMCIKWEIL